jgi:glutamate-1-semialdehyde 2,1-aminomutase
LEEGQRKIVAKHRVPATISRIGSAHCVYFMDHEPANWWQIITEHDFEFDRRYRRELIDRGVYHFPVPTKQGSISFAHTDHDIDQALEATDAALQSLS